MIKVCHLTSVHPRYDTRIFIKQCVSLAGAGYDVTLIVSDGKGHEEKEGVKILDVCVGRFGRIGRMTRTVVAVYKKALNIDANIYHFHDPELIPIGLLLKAKGKKILYDVHEDYPRAILSRHWIPWIIRKPVSWLMSGVEWCSAKAFDAIVAATPKIAERFPAGKTVTIQNFPLANELLSPAPIPYVERPKSFAYVGVIATGRGAIEMIRAFECLNDITCERLELAGEFSPSRLEDTLRALPRWASVSYHGQVSRAQMAQILGKVRAGLVLFHPWPNHIEAQPNKMFEYMGAGLPVIASDFPLWRRIIDGVGCGLLVDPLNPKAIAEAMRRIVEQPAEAEAMGQKGRRAVERQYNWLVESKKMFSLYRELLRS